MMDSSKDIDTVCDDDNNNNNKIETVAHQTLEELSRIQSTSDHKNNETISLWPSSKCSSNLDPSELQSTSRTNIYKRNKLQSDISSSTISSSKSSIFGVDDIFSDLSETNKLNNKTNRKQFAKKQVNSSDQQTNTNFRNNVLEIEQINLNEEDDEEFDDDNTNQIRRLDAGMLDRGSSNNNIDYLISLLPPNDLINHQSIPLDDPIEIRGNGNITLFGLSNCYTSTFPSALLGRVSKEEFEYTINRINNLLQQQHSTNAKFLLLGCLCCCFSLGCSLFWPTFALSKRTKNSLEKLLAIENSRLYNKLGLNWRLSKQPSHTNHSFMEYILVIDFLPKMHIYQPD